MSEYTIVTLELELTEEEAKSFHIKCCSVGMKMTEVIENFIADLTYSDRRNGSDESDYANSWFDRCGFDLIQEKSFLGYLLETEQTDNLLENIEALEIDRLRKIKTEDKLNNPEYKWWKIVTADSTGRHQKYRTKVEWEKAKRDDLQEILEWISSSEHEISEIWNEYLAWAGTADVGTFEDEMKKVNAWQSELPEQEV